jgi:hypothetical protein
MVVNAYSATSRSVAKEILTRERSLTTAGSRALICQGLMRASNATSLGVICA